MTNDQIAFGLIGYGTAVCWHYLMLSARAEKLSWKGGLAEAIAILVLALIWPAFWFIHTAHKVGENLE